MSNYKKHADIWDWSGFDRTKEFEFWYEMSRKYGKDVLSIMCAIGEVGAYMAQKGLNVTALDYTMEMITEGKKRFNHINNMNFVKADARNFRLNKVYDFAFISSTDLHHMTSVPEVKAVLNSVKLHLRAGGGLGLELWYPSEESWSLPRKRFDQLKQVNKTKVWKEGFTSYNRDTKRVTISQEVYKKKDDEIEHFTHEFQMQLYSRVDVLNILKDCDYTLINEYGGYDFCSWDTSKSKWLLELKL